MNLSSGFGFARIFLKILSRISCQLLNTAVGYSCFMNNEIDGDNHVMVIKEKLG